MDVGLNSFTLQGELLVPDPETDLPTLPRLHALKNVGGGIFRELLIEHKATTNKTAAQIRNIEGALNGGDEGDAGAEMGEASSPGRRFALVGKQRWSRWVPPGGLGILASSVGSGIGAAIGVIISAQIIDSKSAPDYFF